jgi:hypothetical protein
VESEAKAWFDVCSGWVARGEREGSAGRSIATTLIMYRRVAFGGREIIIDALPVRFSIASWGSICLVVVNKLERMKL